MSREGQERVCFYLNKDVKRDFHAACIQGGMSMSDWLRKAVHLRVNHYRGNYPDGTPGRGAEEEQWTRRTP